MLGLIYPVIYFDGIVFKSRKDSQIINKCVYWVLGIDMNGHKHILGLWLSENESASFYASICADLKKRGVSEIFTACHDNLKGLGEAIGVVYRFYSHHGKIGRKNAGTRQKGQWEGDPHAPSYLRPTVTLPAAAPCAWR